MTTVKGLLKGLRYISQIFENEKEEEMQIGLPTDVKHVAHIGNDGPSANSPSWMNDFQGSSEAAASGAQNCNGKANCTRTTKSSTKDIQKSWNGPTDSPERRSGKMKQPKRHPHTSSNGSMGSPAREPLSSSKPRRNKNTTTTTTTTSVESPRRQQNSSTGSGSSSQDPNVVPKPSRRKKSKGSGSIRSRAKESSDSLTDTFPYSPGPGYEMTNSGEICQKPVYDEGKDCDEISRGIRAL